MVYKDDELDEETKSYLNSAQDEDAILSSPKGSTSSKSPENPPESSIGVASAPTQQKKVVLKRKLLPSVSLTESETPNAGSTESKVIKMTESTSVSGDEDAAKPSNGNVDGSVVKLSQLTMKERLEMRAKKFGTPVSGDAAKVARSERFGLASKSATAAAAATASATSDSLTTPKSAADVDLLKKRAERFGGSVSNTMVTIEQKEKLLKRQERFGGETTTVTSTATGSVKTATATPATPATTQAASEYAEKAKLRLERFKTAA